MKRLSIVTKLGADEAGSISGIAWSFAGPDRYGDEVAPGAFKSAAGKKLPLLLHHDPAQPVGVWESLVEKSDGLHVTGRLLVDDVPKAREAYALVREGAISGLSIGFFPVRSTKTKSGARRFTEIDLLEISLVTIPAHPGAGVTSAKFINPDEIKALAAAIHRATAALKA